MIDQPQQCPPRRSMNIGMVAYGLTKDLVFVKVPTERGRWVLTHPCVVEVDCPVCQAVSGEPCRRGGYYNNRARPRIVEHGVGVHCARKDEAKRLRRGMTTRANPPHKPRVTAADLTAADGEPDDD